MKKNFIISCLMVGTIVSSCTSNHEDDILSYEQPAKINVTLTNSNEPLKTRNTTDPGVESESELTHVAFYVFKDSDSKSLETVTEAKDTEIKEESYTINCSTGKKRIYAITNDPDFCNEIKSQKGMKWSDFEEKIYERYSNNPSSPLVMVSEAQSQTLKPSTDESIPSATIEITRLVGKVTVKLSDKAIPKFELVGFKIVNANPRSYYFLKDKSYKGKAKDGSKPVDPIENDYEDYPEFNNWTDKYYIDDYKPVNKGEAAYALENWNTDPRRGNTTCIIIEGKYTGAGASGKNTFYRFNLGGKQNSWKFERNKHYQVTIKDVYEDGYIDEGEAEQPEGGKPTDPLVQEVKIQATLTIKEWQVIIQNEDIGKE